MDVAEIEHEPETELARWTADEFVELLDEGFIRDRRIELIDGLMVKEMPQGPYHDFIYTALNVAFTALRSNLEGLVPSKTIVLGSGNVVEPEFTLVRREALGRFGLVREVDVLWVLEVSVTSRRKDLTIKKAAYAASGIPHYWVFDAVRRGVWLFSEPVGDDYAREEFIPAGETIALPYSGESIETGPLFPAV